MYMWVPKRVCAWPLNKFPSYDIKLDVVVAVLEFGEFGVPLYYFYFWVHSDSMSLCLWAYTNLSVQAGCDTRLIFKKSLTDFNSEFSFSQTGCLTNAKESSLSYYLSISGGKITGFIPFPKVLVICEMLSAPSRIWTCVAVSIF